MKHIPQHTLELYVLNQQDSIALSEEIESHLLECEGCRTLVGEMREFHSDLAEEMEADPPVEVSLDRALVRRKAEIDSCFDPIDLPPPDRRVPAIGRFMSLIRRYPITVASTTFVTMGALVVGTLLLVKGTGNVEPDTAYVNLASGTLNISGIGGTTIASIPLLEPTSIVNSLVSKHQPYSLVADIDGDGKKEVVCATHFMDEKKYVNGAIHVFSHDGSILKELTYQRALTYQSSKYYEQFVPSWSVYSFPNTSGVGSDILSLFGSGRSPMVVVRFGKSFNITGEYVHYGNIYSMYSEAVGPAGGQGLILCGQRDSPNSTEHPFPVIIVLDPSKMDGATESSYSPGFGLDISGAEMYYIRLPLTEMDTIRHQGGGVDKLQVGAGPDGAVFSFFTESQSSDHQPTFSWYFTRDFKLVDVKGSDATDKLRNQMKRDGLLTSRRDSTYIRNLKDGIRYWDGTAWQQEPTMVKHPVQSAAAQVKSN